MIDLHAHTIVSDGSFTPSELMREAKRIGLNAIAITDHDSVEGIKEAQEEADKIGIRLIQGLEFDVYYGDWKLGGKVRRMHILGLDIDSENEGFLDIYNGYKAGREEHLEHVFKGLNRAGVQVSPLDIAPHIVGKYMDRQAIAKYLLVEGIVTTMKSAWVDYLDKIEFREGELIDAKSAIEAIHLAGGKAFMAHFHLPLGLKGYDEDQAKACLSDLKAMGLDGLEYYYPSFTKEDQLKCGNYIEEFDFLKSGGSDFHGANRPHISLGIGEGDFFVPDQVIDLITANKNSGKDV